MGDYNKALQNILENLSSGHGTNIADWADIMSQLVGANDAQAIENIYRFIKKNFSFKIDNGAEGYAYFGWVNADGTTRAYQVVDGIVNSSNGAYGYISTTEAGKLFNDEGFMRAVELQLKDLRLTLNNCAVLRDGMEGAGKLIFSEKVKIQSFNDFFSANYIKNLECSNVNTLLSGNYNKNCFRRTEFEAILDNGSINTINGIDKNVFYDLYCAAPSGKERKFMDGRYAAIVE